MAEQTDREKEIEYFGISIDELVKLVTQKAKHREVPLSEVLIDWLELAQSQLDDKYVNINHQLNRIIYILHSGMLIDNPDKK